jgi:hypothetical protein
MGISRRDFLKTAIVTGALGAMPGNAKATDLAKIIKRLLFFYGWPEVANGSSGYKALEVFSYFHNVVWGATIELPTHGQHDFVATLTKVLNNKDPEKREELAKQGITKILEKSEACGYINFGRKTEDILVIEHSPKEVIRRTGLWVGMGVNGILWDCASLTYMPANLSQKEKEKLFKERYELAMDLSRQYQVMAFVNSDSPGLIKHYGHLLKEGDILLLEPFASEAGKFRRDKTTNPYPELQKRGIRVAGVGTFRPDKPEEAPRVTATALKYAREAGLDFLGITDPNYGASQDFFTNRVYKPNF